MMLSTKTSRFVSSTFRKASQATQRQFLTGTRTGRSPVGSAWTHRPADGREILSRWNTTVRCLGTTSGTTTRSKSSVAYAEDDDYEFIGSSSAVENHPSQGHAVAAAEADSVAKSHVEAWMINMGRGNDNAWLTGDREDKWWTGVHPRQCPGTCFLPLF